MREGGAHWWWCAGQDEAHPSPTSPPPLVGLRGRSLGRRSCRRRQQLPQGRGLETQAASASRRSLGLEA